jgi:hypothetical protein
MLLTKEPTSFVFMVVTQEPTIRKFHMLLHMYYMLLHMYFTCCYFWMSNPGNIPYYKDIINQSHSLNAKIS